MDDIDVLVDVWSSPRGVAYEKCVGLAQDFFWVSAVREVVQRADKSRAFPRSVVREGDAVRVRNVGPKGWPVFPSIRLSSPVVEDGLLADFRCDGVPLSEMFGALGVSVDGSAVGWASKFSPGSTSAELLVVDVKTGATRLPVTARSSFWTSFELCCVVTDDDEIIRIAQSWPPRKLLGGGFAGAFSANLVDEGFMPGNIDAMVLFKNDEAEPWLTFDVRSMREQVAAGDVDPLRDCRVLIEVCLSLGVPFSWRGQGTVLIAGSGIGAVVGAVENLGRVVVGVEGFELAGTDFRPRSDVAINALVDSGAGAAAAAAAGWGPDVWVAMTLA